MLLHFYKFQANGNDFVIIDGHENTFPVDEKIIARLCHRQFGIGADGLMIMQFSEKYDFVMQYFNSDGKPAEMCGNGGRCIAAFAYLRNVAGKFMTFEAPDGVHEARIENEKTSPRLFDVSLKMQDVSVFRELTDGWFLNTGVPHFVCFVEDVETMDVKEQGKMLRYDKRFMPDGTNVNFVTLQKNELFVRTYERGVENETLSCGTGVTASALATFLKTRQKITTVRTRGGNFKVDFKPETNQFKAVWLRGPAEKVFEGTILL